MSSHGHKVVFLDRDGTINETTDGWWKQENFVLIDGVVEALQKLRATGYTLALITNQGGVATGLYSEDEVISLHQYMQDLLAQDDAQLDALAYCPHYKENPCTCRKPKPDMAKHIEEQIGQIDYANSWMIGDKDADVGWGKNNGTKTALIRSGYWEREEDLQWAPDLVVDSLKDFANRIL